MIGTSMCGIVMSNGSDCRGVVPEGSALNLCDPHLKAAFDQYRLGIDPPKETLAICPGCEHPTMHPGLTGALCVRCGEETDDFTGRVVTYAQQAAKQDKRVPLAEPEVVYYIQFGDRIKIGTSKQIRKRIQQLPVDKVLGIEKGGRARELQRHRQFAHLHIIGEWFAPAPDLLDHIKNLNGPGMPFYQDAVARRASDARRGR